MNLELARSLARQLVEALADTAPPPPPPPPVEPPPVSNGGQLQVWGEVRVTTPAIFSGFFTQKVRITVMPMYGGGKMVPVELIANGVSYGSANPYTLEPGSYQLILKGGSQIPGAMQSVVARPA